MGPIWDAVPHVLPSDMTPAEGRESDRREQRLLTPHIPMSANQRFQQYAAALGYSFDGEIKIGGNYAPVIRDGALLYVSGQIPRVGDEIVASASLNVFGPDDPVAFLASQA